jgi:toxin-antitoxin system PIN domain toxin
LKRALLDINVLIALLDLDHAHHGRARNWLEKEIVSGWASCPLTENGCVRIMSQPRYPNPLQTGEVISRLREAAATSYHEFWPDDLSILDLTVIDSARVHGPKQVTDLYLLALALKHGGRFVTFDGAVLLSPVLGVEREHLAVI